MWTTQGLAKKAASLCKVQQSFDKEVDRHGASQMKALLTPAFVQDMQTYAAALHGAGGQQVKVLMRLGDDRAVGAALYAAPAYDICVPAMEVARLSLNLNSTRVSGGTKGERAVHYEANRYSLFVAPAGAEMNWRKEAPSRHVDHLLSSGSF